MQKILPYGATPLNPRVSLGGGLACNGASADAMLRSACWAAEIVFVPSPNLGKTEGWR